MPLCLIRLSFGCQRELLAGLGWTAGLQEAVAEHTAERLLIRCEFDRPLGLGYGLLGAVKIEQHLGECGMGHGILWTCRHRLLSLEELLLELLGMRAHQRMLQCDDESLQ
ncbi:MAG: hypothetical protein GTN78_23830, partial [Gemmatimonadales bacterium]|nr:hypothetical protein [Gemmatimonadales bacterium]